VDRAPARDDAVARDLLLLVHAEVDAAVLDEHVELLERALVHQELDALARRQLATLVLGLDARLAAAEPGVVAPHLELCDNFLHRRRSANSGRAVRSILLKAFSAKVEFAIPPRPTGEEFLTPFQPPRNGPTMLAGAGLIQKNPLKGGQARCDAHRCCGRRHSASSGHRRW